MFRSARSQWSNRGSTFNLKPIPVTSTDLGVLSWDRLQNNGLCLVYNCVQDSTKVAYDVGVRRWFNFCDRIQCDPFLRSQSLKNNFTFREDMVVAFISFSFFDLKLKPTTISNYLAAVRYMFKTSGEDVSFLVSPYVMSARTGMNIVYRSKNLRAKDRTLPITVDFIVYALKYYDKPATPQYRVIRVAMVLAFTCLLRSCEYVGKYSLRGRDVMFEFHGVNLDSLLVVSASDSDLKNQTLSNLRGVIINNSAAKNDTEGEGYRFHYVRQKNSSEVAFDLVEIMFQWAVEASLQPQDPFLSYKQKWKLSYSLFQEAIRNIASKMGLDETRYSTHGFRIGGASVLAAAGVPDYVIQSIGRWKSLAFLTYIRAASALFSSALGALTNPLLFTVTHLRQLNSGVLE